MMTSSLDGEQRRRRPWPRDWLAMPGIVLLAIGCAAPPEEAGWSGPVTVEAGALVAAPPAIADVNGDDHPDLLIVGADPEGGPNARLTVHVNDGQGRFRPVAAPGGAVKVPFPAEALWIAAGDVNEDGHVDAVVAHHDSYGLAILIGRGDGTFEAKPDLAVAHEGGQPHTHSLALADVDGDGHLDILTTCADDNAVAVMLGDGAGGFERAPGSPFAAGEHPYEGLSVARLDGDAVPDVVVPNLWGSAAAVLVGDGTGRFEHAAGSPRAVGPRPGFVAVGELNGDEHADVVVTHDGEPVIDILLGDGTGELVPAPTSPVRVEQRVWGAVVADVDGDGTSDIVLGGSRDRVIILIGDGRGGVRGEAVSFQTPRTGPGRVQVADLNGDGRPDLVVSYYESDAIDVYLGQPRGR